MGGRGAGLGPAAWWWLRWRDVDGGPRLGLGCGRLLFHPREIDAATMISRLRSHQGHLVVASAEQSPDSVKFTLDGRVPLPVLWRLPAVGFPRLGFKGLVLLLGHLHHSVFGLLQFGSLLGGALPSPANLHSLDAANSSSPII